MDEVKHISEPWRLASDLLDKLLPALVEAQKAFKAVTKNRTAKIGNSHSYKYADLSDCLDSCRDALLLHGFVVTQTEDDYSLITTLYHASGQWIRNRVPILVKGAGPQEFGSGLTYSRRYGLTSLLGIVAEEDDDGAGANTTQKREPDRKPDPPRQNAQRPAAIAKSGHSEAKLRPVSGMPATAQQVKLFWVLHKKLGRTEPEWRDELKARGLESTSQINGKDMSAIIQKMKQLLGEQ